MLPICVVLVSVLLWEHDGVFCGGTIEAFSAKSEVMPYRFPMMLGRSYNMSTDAVGVDLFPMSETKDPVVIPISYTESEYSLISSNKNARDFLNVKGELSLKVKGGMVDIKGTGSYLRDSTNRENFVEILVRVHFKTVKHTMHSSAKPVENCAQLSNSDVGTHYLRSIQYGGDMLASLRFIVDKKEDKEHIEAAVKASINVKGVLADVEGQFEKLEEKLTSNYRLEIKLYGTMEIDEVPQSMEKFLELTRKFPTLAKERHPDGVPTLAEMYPVESLSQCNKPKPWERNFALGADMDDIETKFDELRRTRTDFDFWMNQLPMELEYVSEEEMQQLGAFNRLLRNVDRAFREVIAKLDVSEDATRAQFEPAYEAYRGDNGLAYFNKYYRMFVSLKRSIEKGGWCPWRSWTPCTVTCSIGFQRRIRPCNCPPPFGEGKCDGNEVETKTCDTGVECPQLNNKLQCSRTDYINNWNADANYNCPDNRMLKGLHSVHSNYYEDRRWAFHCCGLDYMGRPECRTTPYMNEFGGKLSFACRTNEYISGIGSYNEQSQHDRRWKFTCCSTRRVKINSEGCTWTGQLNSLDGVMNFEVDGNQVIASIESTFDGHHKDRTWKVQQCPYTV